ncbi:TPR-like protein [Terfezia boudieri ATCC MYA-4762]|uniref:TPR-like protein n=1 Tax=Terfezia boudieri ATCC MYA-4762 TaxID=1051890 RepID=A0A3N4LNC9_9PEZI|nr:TPR-like protein [Terfezia boudieri ATCC MYA-4762]
MEQFLREWRQDSMNKHQYESAIFIGDKLLALTDDPKDAFWLAQVHFSTGHYTRAQGFLMRKDLISKSTACKYLAALCLIKQSKYDEALTVLGEKNPTHLFSSHTASNGRKRGESRLRARAAHDADKLSDIRFEAAMCYLRGLVYAKQNAFDRAKECYKDACRIDVKCFEAFDQLMKNHHMSPDEEWAFLESLDFDTLEEQAGGDVQAPEFVKMLYISRLSKYKEPAVFNISLDKLSKDYNLERNCDIQIAKAELLFTQCKFRECLNLCEKIIQLDQYNFSIYPIYLACMHECNEKNKLFLVSHDLADHHPEEPVAWLAVGVYYLTAGKIAEARRYFSKSSMMDPHFGAAWIGFAHTFAAEGEHDQAISAYSTAARLFQGTHLPQLFLGMQHLQLTNITLADEYLNNAFTLCKTDPLLLNELGVVFYHKDHLKESITLFKKALDVAMDIDSDVKAWVATRANLGHAYRRLGMFDNALEQFEAVINGTTRDANIYSAVGLVNLARNKPWEAILACFQALAISPQDPIATEILEKALKENADSGGGYRTDVWTGESVNGVRGGAFRTSIIGDEGELVVMDESRVDDFINERMGFGHPVIGTPSVHRSITGGSRSSVRRSTRNHPFGASSVPQQKRPDDTQGRGADTGGVGFLGEGDSLMEFSDEEL